MSLPLVSVVMPCFNAERFVEQAVRSALGQTHGRVELLVVDDGSTDGSAAVLARLQAEFGTRLTRLRTERTGPYPARNLALRHAAGELVAFLDADDWWEPDFLASAWAALQTAQADLAYCGWQNVADGAGRGAPGTEPYVPPAYEQGDVVEHFLRGCPWPIHAALVRREVLDAVGGFSERLFSSMDYDLWLRLLAVTRRLVRVPRVLAYYRWHGAGQISAVKWRQVLDAASAQRDFVRAQPQLVAHLPRARIAELIEGRVLQQAYKAVWARDLDSAQRLFRHATRAGAIGVRDLRHVLPAWLPPRAYRACVGLRDRRPASTAE
ncbi:MAG: glycosyltransferase [Burkholderiales bacterium]|nr:glycosyltransferase [Burkholderiales bacterium]